MNFINGVNLVCRNDCTMALDDLYSCMTPPLLPLPSPPPPPLPPSLPPLPSPPLPSTPLPPPLPSPPSWFFGDVARAEAEKWLLTPSNPSGTFLVRVSSSQKNSLSLSLRDGEGIKHYRIRKLDDGGYFIASRITFRSLPVS